MLDSRAEAFHNGGSVTEAPDTEAGELVGTVLAGRYRIERLLGSGGMGSVYRAEHVLMRKACAVKVLHREMTEVKEVVRASSVKRWRRLASNIRTWRLPPTLVSWKRVLLPGAGVHRRPEPRSAHQRARRVSEERALLISRQITDALAPLTPRASCIAI